MQTFEIIWLKVTTAVGGAGTATSEHPVTGYLEKVVWVDGDFADGVDAVLSFTPTFGVSETLLTLTDANNDAVYYPRDTEDDLTGSAQTTLTRPVVDGTLLLTVASGGDAKTGGAIVYVLV